MQGVNETWRRWLCLICRLVMMVYVRLNPLPLDTVCNLYPGVSGWFTESKDYLNDTSTSLVSIGRSLEFAHSPIPPS